MGFLTTFVLAITVMAFLEPVRGDQDLSTFTANLYNAIAATQDRGKNIAISPYSADAALSMAYFGAGGATQSELAAALGINSSSSVTQVAEKFNSINADSPSYTLQSANGVFVQQTFPIEKGFQATVTGEFGANISSVDFAGKADVAGRQINGFVKEKTRGKIQDLFPPGSLGLDSRVVLVNAVYFKANWQTAFTESDTTNQAFTLSNNQTKSVPMMTLQDKFHYSVRSELGNAQVLELPYQDDATSMIIILPNADTGLAALEAALTPQALNAALTGTLSQPRRRTVQLFLPRFKVNTKYDLVDPLQTLGVKAAFSDAANFTGISRAQDLKISKVVQKVFVEVNEKGTEAAAATGVQIVAMLAPIPSIPIVFRVDRPFLYLIRHQKTDEILFMGRVADPTVEN